MTLKTILPLLALLLSMTGCAPQTAGSVATSETPDHHSSQTSIDWAGSYQGTTPCADCPGIETTVSLHDDETYLWLSHYQDKSKNLFVEKGKFEWNVDGNTLTMTSRENKERLIRVGENQLFILDHKGERIRGELSDFYTLKKISFQPLPEKNNLLKNKRWALAEIKKDTTHRLDSAGQRPFIEFDTQKKRISGFAGCNRFFGEYSMQNDSTIQFYEMGATKKYCMNVMATEDHFFDILRRCRHLKISETILIMADEYHEEMAVFIAQKTKSQ